MSKKILVVCAGNSQRSQALAHYIQEYALREGLDFKVKSAGVAVNYEKLKTMNRLGTPFTDKVIRAQDQFEFGKSNREPGTRTPISKELVDEADLIITVGQNIKDRLLTMFPEAARKTKVAKEIIVDKIISKNRADFEDPYSEKPNSPYRKRSLKDSPKGQTFKGNYIMADEARRLAKRIVPKINRL